MKSITLLASLALISVLSACGAPQPATVVPESPGSSLSARAVSASAHRRASIRPHAASKYLYVANRNLSGGDNIQVYAIGGDTPIRTIPVNQDNEVIVDGSDYLYVDEGNKVAAYAPGTSSPAYTVTDDEGIDDIEIGNTGNLFMSTQKFTGSGCQAQINVYASESPTKNRTITSGVCEPTAMAFGPNGYLWVADNTINSYAPGSSTPNAQIPFPSKYEDISIAVDNSGTVYVGLGLTSSSSSCPGAVGVIPSGSQTIAYMLPACFPQNLAIASNGDLYVSNYYSKQSVNSGDGDIQIFASGAKSPFRTITNGLQLPGKIALDSLGNLYVDLINGCSPQNGCFYGVAVYAPGATSPSETITDGLYSPDSLAIY